jgi:hypothetical protein
VATIHTRIDRDQDLTVNTAEGVLTIEDLMTAVEAYLTGEATTKVIWDFCRTDEEGGTTPILGVSRVPPFSASCWAGKAQFRETAA